MKEKLKELLIKADENAAGKMITDYKDAVDDIAEFLAANGVIVPPCKVGETVYILKGNGKIVKGIVESIRQSRIECIRGRWIVTSWFDNYYADSKEAGFECGTNMYFTFEDFGKIVFLSRKEAEAALKGADDGKAD